MHDLSLLVIFIAFNTFATKQGCLSFWEMQCILYFLDFCIMCSVVTSG